MYCCIVYTTCSTKNYTLKGRICSIDKKLFLYVMNIEISMVQIIFIKHDPWENKTTRAMKAPIEHGMAIPQIKYFHKYFKQICSNTHRICRL